MNTNYQIWDEIGTFFLQLFVNILNWTQQMVFDHSQQIAIALLQVVLGWLVGAFVGKLVAKLLRAIGLDVVFGRLGLTAFLKRAEIHKPPSSIAGLAVYWIVIWAAVLLALERLQFDAASEMMRTIIFWIPTALLSLLLVILGLAVGRWLGGLASRALRLAGLPLSSLVGNFLQWGIVIMAVIISMDQAGLASREAILTGLGALLSLILLVGLALAVFSREMMANFFARQLVVREFKAGEIIAVNGTQGRISSFGTTGTRLIASDGTELLVPHQLLVGKVILRQRTS